MSPSVAKHSHHGALAVLAWAMAAWMLAFPTRLDAGPGVFASPSSSHFIADDGSLWAWGNNDYRQLGACTPGKWAELPIRVGNETDWRSVEGGGPYSIGIRGDGELWGWGINQDGQMGFLEPRYLPVPTALGFGPGWVKVAATYFSVLALHRDGTIWTWGQVSHHDPRTNKQMIIIPPTRIGTDSDWVDIAHGFVSIALKADGSVWSWGFVHGPLGRPPHDRGKSHDPLPGRIPGLSEMRSVATAGFHAHAVKADGTLWSWGHRWGRNQQGVDPAPAQVGNDSDWKSVSMGTRHMLALKTDGSVWAWGVNDSGQLGMDIGDRHDGEVRVPVQEGSEDGTRIEMVRKKAKSIDAPRQVGTDRRWTHVSAGSFHSLARLSDGTVRAWGQNSYFQLGVGNMADSTRLLQPGKDIQQVLKVDEPRASGKRIPCP